MKQHAIIEQVKTVSQKLRRACRWAGSMADVDADEDDFLYEILCYLTLAKESLAAHELILVARPLSSKVKPVARWPRKPGKKQNFSYLKLHDASIGTHIYDLCPGIRIVDREHKERSPDVSLTVPTGDTTPEYHHVRGVWDAKFRLNAAHRIDDTEVSDFVFTFWQFGKPSVPVSFQATVPAEFRRAGLLSNGVDSTERDETLIAWEIQETTNYPLLPKTRPAVTSLPHITPAPRIRRSRTPAKP
jgi:hypothetical protein